jgi:hypothetical protein
MDLLRTLPGVTPLLVDLSPLPLSAQLNLMVRNHPNHTSLLQNTLQIKLQQPNIIAKRDMKITHNRVKPSFVGVCRGG